MRTGLRTALALVLLAASAGWVVKLHRSIEVAQEVTADVPGPERSAWSWWGKRAERALDTPIGRLDFEVPASANAGQIILCEVAFEARLSSAPVLWLDTPAGLAFIREASSPGWLCSAGRCRLEVEILEPGQLSTARIGFAVREPEGSVPLVLAIARGERAPMGSLWRKVSL